MKKINQILEKNVIFIGIIGVILTLLFFSVKPLSKNLGEYNEVMEENKKLIALKEEKLSMLSLLENKELRLDIARGEFQISKEGEIIFVFPSVTEDEEDE